MRPWLTRGRELIDTLDDQLLDLLARRVAVVTDLAERKREEGLPFRDPERDASILARWRARAAELGLDPELAERVAREVVGATRPRGD